MKNGGKNALHPGDRQGDHWFLLLLGSFGCRQWTGRSWSVGFVARRGQRIDTRTGIRTSAVLKVSCTVDALRVNNPSETRIANSLRNRTVDGICNNIQCLITAIIKKEK